MLKYSETVLNRAKVPTGSVYLSVAFVLLQKTFIFLSKNVLCSANHLPLESATPITPGALVLFVDLPFLTKESEKPLFETQGYGTALCQNTALQVLPSDCCN